MQCPDWGLELQSWHSLLADIVRLAERLQVKFAFPTRSVHMIDGSVSPVHPDIDSPHEMGKELAKEIYFEPTQKDAQNK